MKMIVAFLRPDRLDPVTRALEHIPHFPGMTVTDARGFGRGKVEEPPDSRRAELTDFTETARIEIVVSDEQSSTVMEVIEKTARTGRRDDGKIFVLPVERGRRIRTGEEGDAAL
ncbi:MAG: P-II family nitrogen regulator [Longimicrobiales bacterium]